MDYSNFNNQLEAERKLQEEIARLEGIVKAKLSRDALIRFGTVKAAHPDLALNLTLVLSNLIKQGRIVGQISDSQLKEFLRQLSEKKDFKIKRM